MSLHVNVALESDRMNARRTMPLVPGIHAGALQPSIGASPNRVTAGQKLVQRGVKAARPVSGRGHADMALGKRKNHARPSIAPENRETRFYIVNGRRVNVR